MSRYIDAERLEKALGILWKPSRGKEIPKEYLMGATDALTIIRDQPTVDLARCYLDRPCEYQEPPRSIADFFKSEKKDDDFTFKELCYMYRTCQKFADHYAGIKNIEECAKYKAIAAMIDRRLDTRLDQLKSDVAAMVIKDIAREE